MGRSVFGKLVPFLLVLVATVALVAVLSAASRVSPEDAADRYIRQAQSQQAEHTELCAPVAEGPGISLMTSLTGFLVLMAIPVAGLLGYARASRKRAARERRAGRRGRQGLYPQGISTTKFRV